MSNVPDAPAPAASRAARLLQMKAISHRFSAYTEEATRGKRVLRLLPTPLDRYPLNVPKGDDGALFSLVVGNDPEVILLVEQGEKPDSGIGRRHESGIFFDNCEKFLDGVRAQPTIASVSNARH